MHFACGVRKPGACSPGWVPAGVTNNMATPPITEKTLEIPRRARLGRRALMRTAWLTADVVAIAACAVLAARAPALTPARSGAERSLQVQLLGVRGMRLHPSFPKAPPGEPARGARARRGRRRPGRLRRRRRRRRVAVRDHHRGRDAAPAARIRRSPTRRRAMRPRRGRRPAARRARRSATVPGGSPSQAPSSPSRTTTAPADTGGHAAPDDNGGTSPGQDGTATDGGGSGAAQDPDCRPGHRARPARPAVRAARRPRRQDEDPQPPRPAAGRRPVT